MTAQDAIKAAMSVAKDVAEGWVSRQRAADVYRVALREDFSIDEVATAGLRAGTEA